MPRLSIIVPFVGSVEWLENTLVSVLQNRPEASEVLVVLGEPYNDPYHIRGEVRFVSMPAESGASLVQLYNAGVEASRGAIVHLLACGCEVQEGWTKSALHHFEDAQVASVAPVLLQAGNPKQILSCGVRYTRGGRRFALGAGRALHAASHGTRKHLLGPTLTAGFYRRTALAEINGFDPALGDEWADVDLALALQSRGYRSQLAEESHIVGRGSQPRPPAFHSGRQAAWMFRRHLDRRQSKRAQVRHALAVTAELWAAPHRLRSWLHMAGRFFGLVGTVPERSTTMVHELNVLRVERSEMAPAERSTARMSRPQEPTALQRRAA